MRFVVCLLIGVFAFASPSWAQRAAPVETVVVTAQKLKSVENVVHDYVRSYSSRSTMFGKLARWERAVCPKTVGLSPKLNQFVTQRLKQVAALVGAKSAPDDSCKGNIAIIFWPKPQEVINRIRDTHPELIGEIYNSPSAARRLATVRHPIQAWYATATVDYRDNVEPDYCSGCFGPRFYVVEGSNLVDGVHSDITNVTIVADLNKVAGYKIGAIADYIAMLALSQTKTFETCQDVPSITSLMSPDCGTEKAEGLTAADLAYLRALYALDPQSKGDLQESELAHHMEKQLEK